MQTAGGNAPAPAAGTGAAVSGGSTAAASASPSAPPAAAAAASSATAAPQQLQPSPLTNPGEDRALESIVLAYLRRRGFTGTEEALRKEAALQAAQTQQQPQPTADTAAGAAEAASSTSATNSLLLQPTSAQDIHAFATDLSLDQHTHLLRQIVTWSGTESSPTAYAHSYAQLERWIGLECMEVYRTELRAVLWPVFVHVFLQLVGRGFPQDAQQFLARHRRSFEGPKHLPDLHIFQNVTTEADLQRIDIVNWYRQRKVEVHLSSFAHQLLLSFLEERHFQLLLKIVNEHLFIVITSRRPLSLEDEVAPPVGLVGAVPSTSAAASPSPPALSPLALVNLNSVPIRYGALPEYASMHAEAALNLSKRMHDAQLAAKMARVAEEKERAEVAAEAAKKKAAAEGAKEAAADDGESAKKKAKTGDGTAAAAGVGDADMTDVADGGAAAGGDAAAGTDAAGAAKAAAAAKSRPRKSTAGATAGADSSKDVLRQTKEEKDAIDAAVARQIPALEPMYVPPPKPPAKDGTPSSTAAEAKRVNIPPIPADVHARYLADLNFRQRLSATTLPSICLHTFLNAQRAINSMNVSNDGALVSAACSDSTVRVYDLRDPSIRQSTNPSAAANKAGELEAKDALEGASFYADGQDGLPSFSPLSASLQPYRRFDDPTHLPYSKLVGHSGPVYSTSFSPEGQHLLSASEDSTIRLWHLETKKNLVIYKGHNYPVWDVSFASVGFYFASASHDHTARLWATNHISPLRMFVGHASDVDVVRFHPNCNYLATASSDSTARLWDVQTGECVRVFVGHEGPVRSLAMDPAGRFMATGGQDGRVCVWDLGTGRQVSSVAASAQGGAVTALDYSADGELLAAGSMDYSLALIEPRKAQQTKPLRTYHTKRTPLHFLHFTPRNLLLAGGVFNAD